MALTRTFALTSFGCAALLALGACGGYGDGGASTVGVSEIYVNPDLGNDTTGTGSRDHPFKTIMRALPVPARGAELVLLPGQYTSASGEVFPIIIPEGVSVRGSTLPAAGGQFARISGVGDFASPTLQQTRRVAIVLNAGSELSSVVVEAPGGVAVWNESDGSDATVLNSGVVSSNIGVVVAGQSTLQVRNSEISGNTASGIEILASAAPEVLNNTITGNGVGVTIRPGASPVFSAANVQGNNTIRSNLSCDVRHLGAARIGLVGTIWDSDPFTFAIVNGCTGGANISVEGTGTVDYQFIPSATALLFPGSQRLQLGSPASGELVFSTEPSLSWTSSGSRLAMAAILTRPPAIGTQGLQNVNDIVWLWHSGLGTANPGSVSFSQGITPVNGNIGPGQPPRALQRGTTYYWAVWEWGADSVSITSSSPVGYFTVSN